MTHVGYTSFLSARERLYNTVGVPTSERNRDGDSLARARSFIKSNRKFKSRRGALETPYAAQRAANVSCDKSRLLFYLACGARRGSVKIDRRVRRFT